MYASNMKATPDLVSARSPKTPRRTAGITGLITKLTPNCMPEAYRNYHRNTLTMASYLRSHKKVFGDEMTVGANRACRRRHIVKITGAPHRLKSLSCERALDSRKRLKRANGTKKVCLCNPSRFVYATDKKPVVGIRQLFTIDSETPVCRTIDTTVAPLLLNCLISSILSIPITSNLANNRRS